MTTAIGFKPQAVDEMIIVENVLELIDSDCITAADGDYCVVDAEIGHRRDQLIDCLQFKYTDCKLEFIESCRRDGIKYPSLIKLYGAYWEVQEGHHRMAVAWVHKLPLPVVFATSWAAVNTYDSEEKRFLTSRKENFW